MAPFREVKTARASGSRGVCYSPAGSAMTHATSTLYRIFYDGLLSRLPEPTAIALGQNALRALPSDRVPLFR